MFICINVLKEVDFPMIEKYSSLNRNSQWNLSLAVTLFCIMFISNVVINIIALALFVLFILPKKKKYDDNLVYFVLLVQISLCLLAMFLRKFEIYFWQGFFLGCGNLYYISKKIFMGCEQLSIILPLCIAMQLLALKENKYAVFWGVCALFHWVYFLPLTFILYEMKIKKSILLFFILWGIEFTVTESLLFRIPPYVQWIDFIFALIGCVYILFTLINRWKNKREI